MDDRRREIAERYEQLKANGTLHGISDWWVFHGQNDIRYLLATLAAREAEIGLLATRIKELTEALTIIAGPRRGHGLTDYLAAHGDPRCTTLADQYAAAARAALARSLCRNCRRPNAEHPVRIERDGSTIWCDYPVDWSVADLAATTDAPSAPAPALTHGERNEPDEKTFDWPTTFNWDGYGGSPTDQRAVLAAYAILRLVKTVPALGHWYQMNPVPGARPPHGRWRPDRMARSQWPRNRRCAECRWHMRGLGGGSAHPQRREAGGDMSDDIRVGPTFEQCSECGGDNDDGYGEVVHFASCSRAPEGKRAKMEPTRVDPNDPRVREMLGLVAPCPSCATLRDEIARLASELEAANKLLDGLRTAMRSCGPDYHLVSAASDRMAKAGHHDRADRLEHVYGRLYWMDFALGTLQERAAQYEAEALAARSGIEADR